MPPPLASRDSPRSLHGRRRQPRGQLTRPGSIFGAIKNIVTAPLAWLTSYDDNENLSGKRGRNNEPVLEEEAISAEEDQRSAKRKRVDSPQFSPPPQPHTRLTQGYLDVPENMLSQFANRQRQGGAMGHGRASSMAATLTIPTTSTAHPARRTASPTGITSYMQPFSVQRTQSMDPPAYRALSLSRDVSMEEGIQGSAHRDVTMSPSRRTAFQLRARNSMTPQPTGQTFGPTPRAIERDVSEPPPLAALISKPVFVKPPAQTHVHIEQPLTTLGTLAENNGRSSRSPMRQHSGLFLGARAGPMGESGSAPYMMPMNAAEKALHDLDVYKTPLLPSRLRGAQTIPEMFQPKKSHAPVLMRSDRDRERKPRLGTSEKGKKKEEEAAVIAKPYAGRGGMKKMLARRKREEQEELEKERANAIETDQDELDNSLTEQVPEIPKEISGISKAPTLPPAPVLPVGRLGGREQSSLRVGRTRTSRNHIARPVSKAHNRFSAAFDDDEGEDTMVDEDHEQQNSEKLPTLFEGPKGFTFAQQAPPVLHDSSNAKEPPIAALPFSLTKSSGAPPPAAPAPSAPFSFAEPPKTAGITLNAAEVKAPEAKPVAPVSLFPSMPSISLIPPSPAPAKLASDAPPVTAAATVNASVPSSIPNFFANSSIFAKPGVTIAPPTPSQHPFAPTEETTKPEPPKVAASSFTFGAAPTLVSSAPKENTANTEAAKPTTTSAFSFGAPAAAQSELPSSGHSTSTSLPFSFGQSKDKENCTQPPPPSFAAPPAAAPVAQTAPVAATEVKAAITASSPFSFGQPAKTVEVQSASTTLPFSFGQPSVATPVTPATPAIAPVSTSSPFSFGQNKAEQPKPSEQKSLFGTTDTTKPLFGAPASSPSPFGGSQASAGAEPSKPAFTFGQSTPSAVSTPTVEAPKPMFPSTSTGGTGGFSFGSTAPAASSAAAPVKSPFAFGASPSTPAVSTPTDNKSPFNFGASSTPTVSAPTTLFGGPSGGSHGTDVSKPPLFGTSAPPRALTPPQKEQEMRMEESPTRGGMEMNSEQSKPAAPFSFGASTSAASNVFGQSSQSVSSPFAFGAKTEVKPESKSISSFASFGQSNTATPFGFGQKPAESVQSPISPAPFGSSTPFGQTPTTSAPAFNFGSSTSVSTGGFGQSSAAMNSQPASPSTFGQPAPFSFGVTPTSATATSNPFAFGSQPASPATGNAGLPQPPGSSGGPSFTFGASSPATTQSPASPFGVAPSLPTPSGGVGFTIGSAAPQPPPGSRQIKKLPNRRAGRR